MSDFVRPTHATSPRDCLEARVSALPPRPVGRRAELSCNQAPRSGSVGREGYAGESTHSRTNYQEQEASPELRSLTLSLPPEASQSPAKNPVSYFPRVKHASRGHESGTQPAVVGVLLLQAFYRNRHDGSVRP
eukprot:7202751-Prymnesium_polylepis.1